MAAPRSIFFRRSAGSPFITSSPSFSRPIVWSILTLHLPCASHVPWSPSTHLRVIDPSMTTRNLLLPIQLLKVSVSELILAD